MAKKRIVAWVLLPIVVCAVMALGEAWFLKDVLRQEVQGVISLPATEEFITVSAPAAEETEEFYEEEWDEYEAYDEYEEAEEESEPEDTGALLIPGGGSATVDYTGHINYLNIIGTSLASDGRYTVSGVDVDGAAFAVTSFLGGDGIDTVRIDRYVRDFTISIYDTGCELTGLQVDNSLQVNPVRMLFFGLCAAAVYLLIILREVIAQKAEIGYLIIALAVGIFMCIALPANTGVSYDDGIHANRIFQLSRGKHTALTPAENALAGCEWSEVYEESHHHTWDTWIDEQRYDAIAQTAAQDQTLESEEVLQWMFSDAGYVTQAVGAVVARALRLPFLWQVRVIRLFNMLTYVALTYLAIRVLKRFKLTMACVALMPTALFLASNFSYDPTTNGLCFLGIALVVDAILDRRTLLTRKRAAAILLCILLGAMTKVVYMPLLLLVLMLPRSKFESQAAKWWFKTLAVVLCIVAVGVMVLGVTNGSVGLQDDRAGGADSAGQIAYLLAHPLTYLGTFFKVIFRDFELYFVHACRFAMGYVSAVSGTVSLVCLGLTLFTAFTDNDTSLGQKMNWKLRLGMLIVGGLAVGMVFTTMYVAGAPVGATEYWGVQGRYMIPMIPLMLMILSPDGIQNRMNKKAWHMIFFLLQGVILATVCWNLVLGQYWL
ncbi:MAG: DUF2142 domain-containing protein [Clostridia bacterium]|nr:DUF2142 domain-containing protein [Clostridia bacterium]